MDRFHVYLTNPVKSKVKELHTNAHVVLGELTSVL